MAIFKTVSESHFEIDGVLYPKIYDLKKDGSTIVLFNIHTEKWLDGSFKIEDITVETKVRADFASETLFLNELKSLVFKKGGGNGEGLQAAFWEATSTDTTTDYIYKGGLNGTDWQINRYDRANNMARTSATVSNNNGTTTLTEAWADRLTINYV